MSTIHFDAAELANIASVLRSHHDDASEVVVTLAEFSAVNTQAYNARYGEKASPVTVEELRALAHPMNNGHVPQAAGTLGLMEYNCDGLMTDTLAAEIGRLAIRVMRKQSERLAQAREHIEYLNARLREQPAAPAPVKAKRTRKAPAR